MIKNSAKNIINKSSFSENFEKNKKILAGTMPSKKIKNKMAGFLARLKKQEKKNKVILEKKEDNSQPQNF